MQTDRPVEWRPDAFEPFRQLGGVTLKRNPGRKRWEIWEGSTLVLHAKTYRLAERLWRKYVDGRDIGGENGM